MVGYIPTKRKRRPSYAQRQYKRPRVRKGYGPYGRMPGRYRDVLGIELKFLDCAWNGVAINISTDGASGEIQPSSGCTNAISIPAQGDGEQERDGRKYTLKSCFASGIVDYGAINDSADATEVPSVFLALVLDTQANGATIVSENVYDNPSTSGAAMLPQPLRNLSFSKRYRVLDHTTIIPNAMMGTDGTNTNSINAQAMPPFKLSWSGNIVCDSTGTTADVASASDNAIHLIGYKTTSDVVTVVGKSRVRFVG